MKIKIDDNTSCTMTDSPLLADLLLKEMQYHDTTKVCCRACKHRKDLGREGPEPHCTLNGAISIRIEDSGCCKRFKANDLALSTTHKKPLQPKTSAL